MSKKITALCAALLITASLFTGCKKPAEDTDPTLNIIQNGTEAPAEGGETETTPFVDPGAALFGDSSGAAEGDEPPEQTEATLPENHEEIVSMIENASTDAAPAAKPAVLKEYNVDYKTRYGYNTLNDAEKKLYADILEAAKSIKLKVPVDDSVTEEMWIKVYGCVYMQEPELFWLTSKKVAKGKLWYWETDPDAIAEMQKKIDQKASEVASQANGKSTFDQLKVFHDYITLNNDFIKEEGFNQTIYGGFVTGTLQCEGYAKTMHYLCDMAGIESMVIVGSNEANDSHAWNIVKVDGKWYNLDCTWDDPILKEVDHTNVRYRYFLVPDEWIHNKSHFNVNRKISGTQLQYFAPPSCTSEDMNYFKVTNQLYSDASSADSALKEKLKATASSKMRAAEIRVSSKSVYDSVTANLKDYATWIKNENSSVSSVTSNCDPNTLVIELDLIY